MYLYQPNQQYCCGDFPSYNGNPLITQQDSQDLLRSPNMFGTPGYNGYYNPYGGMMGGYYNGGYYNPYLFKEQQRQQQQYQQDVAEAQFKLLNKLVNVAYKNELSQDESEKLTKQKFYDHDNLTKDELNLSDDEAEYLSVSKEIKQVIPICNQELNNIAYKFNQVVQSNTNEDLYDWMTRFDELQREEQHNKSLSAQRDLSGEYNSNSFNQLLMGTNNTIDFNPVTTNVDDMSVTLPLHLRNGYNQKRQAFLNAIMSQKVG